MAPARLPPSERLLPERPLRAVRAAPSPTQPASSKPATPVDAGSSILAKRYTSGDSWSMNERIAPSLLECVAPATSQVIGHVKIASPDEVRSAVERARAAQRGWGALPVATRVERLLAFRDKLLEAPDELAVGLSTVCRRSAQGVATPQAACVV